MHLDFAFYIGMHLEGETWHICQSSPAMQIDIPGFSVPPRGLFSFPSRGFVSLEKMSAQYKQLWPCRTPRRPKNRQAIGFGDVIWKPSTDNNCAANKNMEQTTHELDQDIRLRSANLGDALCNTAWSILRYPGSHVGFKKFASTLPWRRTGGDRELMVKGKGRTAMVWRTAKWRTGTIQAAVTWKWRTAMVLIALRTRRRRHELVQRDLNGITSSRPGSTRRRRHDLLRRCLAREWGVVWRGKNLRRGNDCREKDISGKKTHVGLCILHNGWRTPEYSLAIFIWGCSNCPKCIAPNA